MDIDGSFNCKSIHLRSFHCIMFGKVTKDFDCSENNLESLKEAPDKVEQNFYYKTIK